MSRIGTERPVLVTGANGYVAGWLVRELLQRGYTVHAAVRDPDNKEKTAHLDKLAANGTGKIRYFEADLLNKGSYAEAMEGCELVFHTASPFTSDFDDAQKELIDPAVKGTANVLEQANQTPSVKRVVVTSSCAAIYTDATECAKAPTGMLTEDIWNSTASLEYQPYSYSKTLAEKKAWEIYEQQSRWELVVVNPSMVMGPALNPENTTSESFKILKQMGDGTLKFGVPNLGMGVVDVRDLGVIHFNAGTMHGVKGRHIASGSNTTLLEMARLIHGTFGKDYPVPKKPLPKWLLLLIGPMVNSALSRQFVSNNVNRSFRADNSKSKKALNAHYRPLQETMIDSFQALIGSGLIAK
ncbi:NAD-dependent epimerase/dehydratase family protein [Robertkochia aurantiaca]|uniref:NAD-dependent epimerase/dehydratase family protein n=1 Tax=Robertkochia aurantiaca TaxID=2873700 RepID=UPI001CCA7B75|nr:NAD-dependent epimerase/dehydratase family protein [Robertkochia sp. 3YJGBD-33]